jgi:hypothetical protein
MGCFVHNPKKLKKKKKKKKKKTRPTFRKSKKNTHQIYL